MMRQNCSSPPGGFTMHRTARNHQEKKTYAEKKTDARLRAESEIGRDQIKNILERWSTLETHRHGCASDGDIGDGILLCLLKLDMSTVEIQSFLPVGSSRLTRLRKFQSHSNNLRVRAHHALSNEEILTFKCFFESLEVEDGFPCAHRRPKFYIHNDGKSVQWKEIYEKYKLYAETNLPEGRIMKQSTFRHYRNWLFPGHSLSKKKEDLCDNCVRLNLVISNPESPPEKTKRQSWS